MDIETFTRAANNGLGRVILWLQNHPWRPYGDAITHLCLHNTAYDPQCEGSRAEYVHEIVGLTDAKEHFADLVTRNLLVAKDFWDTDHLYRLARLFAQDGYTAAREAMYSKFRLDDAEEHFIGDMELVELDGVKGLLFVLEQVGRLVQANPDYWVDDCLLSQAKDLLGDTMLPSVTEAAKINLHVARYMQAVEEWRQRSSAPSRSRPNWREFSYPQLREWIVQEGEKTPRAPLWIWGQRASPEALRAAATDLLAEEDPRRQVAYLRVFRKTAFPLDPRRVVELATTGDEQLADAALAALHHTRHAAVRALFANLAAQRKAEGDVVRLLIANYEPGDEQVIESLLAVPTDEDVLHWLCHAAVEVFEANETADALQCMVHVYERCRCSICRDAAVDVLVARKNLPEWMRLECRHDSNPDIRRMMTQST